MIITLDGPAGVGKSTLARAVAQKLDIPYLDSGAMFRFIALSLGEGALQLPGPQLAQRAAEISFTLSGGGDQTCLAANGKIIGDEIRSEQVGALASALAKKPELRQALLEAQRELGQKTDLVAEGRDMGTVVFPSATCKFFLDATPETRAQRRWLELKIAHPGLTLEEVAAAIRKRDEQDSNRIVAPLVPAPDARIIDTSSLTLEEALAIIMSDINAKLP